MVSLETFDLSNNQLTEIKAKTFNGLIKLKGIFFGFNQIGKIYHSLFDGLQIIKEIYMQNNKIASIENLTFYGMKLLILSSNQLKSVSVRDLYYLNLKDIELCENQIQFVDELVCDNFEKLKIVWEVKVGIKPIDCSNDIESTTTAKNSAKPFFINNVNLNYFAYNIICFLFYNANIPLN